MTTCFSTITLYFQLLTAIFTAGYVQAAPVQPVNLQCEHLINPLGIDAMHPRFTWQLQDSRTGALQTAYQLYVATDPASLNTGRPIYWVSAKTNSNLNLATYQGKTLMPFTRYYWQVAAWDKSGLKSMSAIQSFETGMMEMKNWKGVWISDRNGIAVKPAPYFRQTFTVSKKIKSARAYIAAAGLYELFVNGQKIGNHRMDPMYTRFDRRTLYVTYDVTSQAQSGKNAIGVLLGNGWYNHQSTAVWNFDKAPWRARPAFCLDLRITYEDGSTETITSDERWKTSLGPLVFNSIYTAEHYDARLEQPGWNTANFQDSSWKPVFIRQAPSNNIAAQVLHPIRNIEEIPSKSVRRFNDKDYVFDLERNISGVSRFTITGDSGTTIRLVHAERLKKDGHADLSNIDVHYRPTDDKDPFQTDIFILGGKGEETFMPRFNYKGFQFVEVNSDKPLNLTKENLTGYFMHSDVPPVGTISSSNPTIDTIWQATNNSYLSNLFGYPTDCPQREKNGWTGDAHIASETGLYSYDAVTIYEKWMADHRDEQQPNGVLPSIIPSDGWGYEWGNGPDWTSTIAIIPWNIYLFYGDSKPLSDNYENIRLYVNHIDDLYPSGLTTWGLGDWVPVKSVSPVELTSSAYYYVDATILAKAARILGKKTDEIKYTALANKIKNAINAKYLDVNTGIYNKGLQTELSVPLCWGIVPEPLKAKVAANLAKRVAADSFHLDVGILGAKAVLNALSENGYADVAYKVASQETFPSWGWWIVNNATTLYENWNIEAKSDISLNHIMFGEIGAWLYKGLGGIKPDEKHPGFKNVLLAPNFVAGLDSFEAIHNGSYGKIVSSWKRVKEGVEYAVTIPANSTATVSLPLEDKQQVYFNDKKLADVPGSIRLINTVSNSKQYQVQSGTYRFLIR